MLLGEAISFMLEVFTAGILILRTNVRLQKRK